MRPQTNAKTAQTNAKRTNEQRPDPHKTGPAKTQTGPPATFLPGIFFSLATGIHVIGLTTDATYCRPGEYVERSRVFMRERYLAIAIFLIVATAVLADLSPDVYKDLQRKAPEVFYIQVSSVNVHRSFAKPSGCSFFEFEVIRNVQVEARSASGSFGNRRSSRRCHRGRVFIHQRVFRHERAAIDSTAWEGDRIYACVARRGRSTVFEPAARGATFSGSMPGV